MSRESTHHEECWMEASHHGCAIIRITRLEAERHALRRALSAIISRATLLDSATALDIRDIAKAALGRE